MYVLKYDTSTDHVAFHGPLQDIDLSKDIIESFRESTLARTKLPSGIETSVHVLTMGYWPSYTPVDMKLPNELNVYQVQGPTFVTPNYEVFGQQSSQRILPHALPFGQCPPSRRTDSIESCCSWHTFAYLDSVLRPGGLSSYCSGTTTLREKAVRCNSGSLQGLSRRLVFYLRATRLPMFALSPVQCWSLFMRTFLAHPRFPSSRGPPPR